MLFFMYFMVDRFLGLKIGWAPLIQISTILHHEGIEGGNLALNDAPLHVLAHGIARIFMSF